MTKQTITLIVAFLLGYFAYEFLGRSIVPTSGGGGADGGGSGADGPGPDAGGGVIDGRDIGDKDSVIGKLPGGQAVVLPGRASHSNIDNVTSFQSLEHTVILGR